MFLLTANKGNILISVNLNHMINNLSHRDIMINLDGRIIWIIKFKYQNRSMKAFTHTLQYAITHTRYKHCIRHKQNRVKHIILNQLVNIRVSCTTHICCLKFLVHRKHTNIIVKLICTLGKPGQKFILSVFIYLCSNYCDSLTHTSRLHYKNVLHVISSIPL